MRRPALLLLPLVLAACAHSGPALDRVAITDVARADPWEKTNRQIYGVSTKIDRYFFVPVTEGYRAVVPAAARRGIGNAYDLLQEPTHAANAVAQGKIKSAFRALDRILINTTLGLGVADHATAMGLSEQEHDFGQTMAVWGIPSGPFVMLPFLGPSTARDSVGFFVDFLLDPMDYVEGRVLAPDEQIVKLAIRLIDTRSNLRDQGEQLLVGAADPYATIRSAWLQLRRYQIFDGTLPDEEEEAPLEALPPLPDDGDGTISGEVTADEAPAIAEALSPLPLPDAGSATAPSTPEATDPAPAPPQG